MNGFADHGLSEEDFGASKGGLRSFDAFPKTKSTYITRTRSGGVWTVVFVLICGYLSLTETIRWFRGNTTHAFSVEKGIGHELQINLDIVVAMACADLHVNVQDAAGDRILAAEALRRDPTSWAQWGKGRGLHKLGVETDRGWEEEEDVHDYIGLARKKRKFARTPRVRGTADACRIYGSLEGNKVQGDFHITARGHGYMEFGGQHLDHSAFNFSHRINELSFGPFYPSLENPLDNTIATTPAHFYRFQYYLSVVPTIYTDDPATLNRFLALSRGQAPTAVQELHEPHPYLATGRTVFTNQYAVTEQSRLVGETQVPGVFVKFDIEPITLTISEEWGGFLALLVRLVNVASGVLVAGGWCYQLVDWANGVWGKRRNRGNSLGMLHGGVGASEKSW